MLHLTTNKNSMSTYEESQDAETTEMNNIVLSEEETVEKLMTKLKLKETKLLLLEETVKCLQEQLNIKNSNSSADYKNEIVKVNKTESQNGKLNCHENEVETKIKELEEKIKKLECLENEIKISDDKLKSSNERLLALENELQLKESAFQSALEEISNLKKQLKLNASELHATPDDNKCLESELKNNSTASTTENYLEKQIQIMHDELEPLKRTFDKQLEAKDKELKLVNEDTKMRSCYNEELAKKDKSINTEMDMWSICTFVPKKDKSSQTCGEQFVCSTCRSSHFSTIETQTSEELHTSETEIQYWEMEVDPSARNEDSNIPEESEETMEDMRRRTDDAIASNPDYVYIETLKIYYSSSTGFYYDPETGISTDSRTGTRYIYNPETQAYCLFIPRTLSQQTLMKHLVEQLEQKKRRSSMPEKPPKVLKSEDSEIETEDDSGEVIESIENSDSTQSLILYLQEQAKLSKEILDAQQVPPSVRCIVLESKTLQKGSLLLVTYTGVIIGRDATCTMCIPDSEVSHTHARIDFDTASNSYCVTDLGSVNGTYLNYYRLSEPKEQSESYYLSHEDFLSIARCKLLVHIHKGTETCDNCEPGQVHNLLNKLANEAEEQVLSKEEKETERRKVLKNLKKKFGLDNAQYEDEKLANIENLGYKDLAKERQKTKGSDNPYEKTEVQSLEQSLTAKNKGFKLLQKMGWTEGEGLGKTSSGILEPVPIPASVQSSTIKKKPVLSKAAMRHFQREIGMKSGKQSPASQAKTSESTLTPINFVIGTPMCASEKTSLTPLADFSKLEHECEADNTPVENNKAIDKQSKIKGIQTSEPTEFLAKLVGKKSKKKRRCHEMVDCSQANQS